MTYGNLAKLYDFLMKDAPYEEWVNFTESFKNSHIKNEEIKILDVGCGTGQVTWRLAERGYQMTGVDLSEDMLTEADALATEKNLSIQWLKQDMTELSGLTDFDLVISYCDVVNYLTDTDKLKQAFQRIFQSLSPGGVFLFDVHDLNYVQHYMADQLFSEVYDDLAYIWFCHAGEHLGEMFHELSFFVEENNVYHRFDETHHQKTYPIPVYLNLLSKVGFQSIDVFSDFKTEPIVNFKSEELGNRIFFVCHKNN